MNRNIGREKTPFVIFLDGLPGAGKSSITASLRILSDNDKTCRKIDVYEEYINQPMLSAMLEDIHQYGFTYQIMMLQRQISTLNSILNSVKQGNSVISDRSHIGDSSFAHNLAKSGIITPNEWKIYTGMMEEGNIIYRRIKEETSNVHNIYLNVPPRVARARILNRGRLSESSYTLMYLKGLEDSHKKMYEKLGVDPTYITWDDQTPEKTSKGDIYDCGSMVAVLSVF